MKVLIKDLKLGEYAIDIDPTSTIEALRTKIIEKNALSNFAVTLLYSGKVLKDEDVIQNLNISASKAIICLKKPKADSSKAPKSAAVASSSVTTSATTSTPASQTRSTMPPAPQAPVAPAPTSDLTPRPTTAPSTAPADGGFESKLESLTQAGFDRDEATWALNETGGNVDHAANLLMTAHDFPEEGIDIADAEAEIAAGAASGRAQIVLNRDQIGSFLAGLVERSPGQFDQVVAALQSNPEQLVQILDSMDLEQRRSFLQLLQSNPLSASASGGADIGDDAMGDIDEEDIAEGTTGAVAPEPAVKDIQTLTSMLGVDEAEARNLLLAHRTVENVVEAFFNAQN